MNEYFSVEEKFMSIFIFVAKRFFYKLYANRYPSIEQYKFVVPLSEHFNCITLRQLGGDVLQF